MKTITSLVEGINIFNKKIPQIAADTGFTIRKSKLDPLTFCKTFILGVMELKNYSLDTFCGFAEDIKKGLDISKQGIFKKLEAGSDMLKRVFKIISTEHMNSAVKFNSIEVLNQFNDVKINDSTTISLPNKLKPLFKGLGGKNSDSAVKLQATYSLFKSEFINLDFYPATVNDSKYNKETLKDVSANDLIIKDLGYYDVNYFNEIESKKAFFISRIKTSTIVYKKDLKGNFVEENFKKLFKKNCNFVDKKVYIKDNNCKESGYKEFRLTAIRIPNILSESKKRKEYIKLNKEGKTISTKKKVHLEWFITISNIPEDMLTLENIIDLYRYRWQIELQFKAFKQNLNLENFGNVGEHYFYCMLYAKLIAVTILMRIYSITKVLLYQKYGRFLSIQKFIKNVSNKTNYITEIWSNSKKARLNIIDQNIVKIGCRSLFEKCTRKSTEDRLKAHDLPEETLHMLINYYS